MSIVDALARDIHYGVRSLRRDLSATLFIVAIAGIGIGASTTVFSIVRALVLRPLPFEQPERLVWIANGNSENLSAQTVQVNNLLELREKSRSYVDVAGFFPFYAPGDIRLTGAGEPERLTGVPVTQNFFPLLGVTPLAGRFFDDAESLSRAPQAVVLGHDFWLRRYNGDRGIVGRSIILDDVPVTVVGVLPASFDFAATFTPGRRVDVFVPFPLTAQTNRQGNTLALIGRLRSGVPLDAAQREATVFGSQIRTGNIDGVSRNGFGPRLSTLREHVSGRFEPALVVLTFAVSFVMLLVCANLSNLLLVRASRRRRDMALRVALGAPRSHLIRQMMVESLLLCAGGAALGIGLAAVGTFAISRLQGTTIPLLNSVQLDTVALGFTVLVAVVTGLAFGLFPAVHASAFSPPSVLADGGRGSIGGRAGRIRNAIVATEIALVCVLLTGAGLLARSLGRVLEVQPGFTTENVMAVRVDLSANRPTPAQRIAYFDEVVRAVGSIPGVQSLGLTDALPLGDNFGWRRWSAAATDKPQSDDQSIDPLVRMIDEGYLAAMKISVRSGRAFNTADNGTSEPVIIINETLARTMWPGQDAIGRFVRTSGVNRRVVGVVADVRYFGLDRDPDAEMYMPLRQPTDYQSIDLVVRGAISPIALVPSIRAELRRIAPNLPIGDFRTMEALVDQSVFARHFVVLLVGGFAAFGLLLASLGIYAVISYSVAQRTQEIGIRMALGATQGNVLRRILEQTGGLVLAGLVVGLPFSWMAARAIRGFLFDVGTSNPATFIGVLIVLGGVAALAGFLPARRAAKVDPAIALRSG
jgi:predicted permease